MSNLSKEIHDLIQQFDLSTSRTVTGAASDILDILQAMNRRMDEIEARLAHAEKFAQVGQQPRFYGP